MNGFVAGRPSSGLTTEVAGISELYAIINGLKAGDWLTLEICRNGEIGEVSYQLMEAASPLKN